MRERLEAIWADPAIRTVLVVTVAIEAVLVGIHTFDAVVTDTDALSFFSEASIPSIGAALLLAATALACLRCARTAPTDHRLAWGLLALVFALLAIEEGYLNFHEDVEEAFGKDNILVVEVLAAPLIAIGLAATVRRLPSPAPLLLLLAVGALALGQAAELASNTVFEDVGASRNLFVVLEEWGEMLIATFGIAAAAPTLAGRFASGRPGPRPD